MLAYALGPSGPMVRPYLLKLVGEFLQRGEEVLYLVPTRHLAREVREGMLEMRGGFYGLHVLTFDEVVDQLGGDATPIAAGTRELILGHLLIKGNLSPNCFEPLKTAPGLLQALGRSIGELKRAGILPREFLERAAGTKLRDLGRLYEVYQEFLEERGLADLEEAYLRAVRRLAGDEEGLLPYSFLVVEHFADFAPLQLKLLKGMLERIPQAYIYLPMEREMAHGLPWLWQEAQKVIALLEERGLAEEETPWIAPLPLTPLRHRLWQIRPEKQEVPGIHFLGARTPWKELKGVAKEIKGLVAQGVSPRDIALILPDRAVYGPLLHRVMEEEGISLTEGQYADLLALPLLRDVLHLLHLPLEGWRRIDLHRVARSPYLGLACPAFPRVAARLGLTGGYEPIMERLKGEAAQVRPAWEQEKPGRTKEALAAWLEQVEAVQAFLGRLKELLAPWEKAVTLDEYGRKTRRLLGSLRLEQRILGWLKKKGDDYPLWLGKRDLAAWRDLLGALDALQEQGQLLDLLGEAVAPGEYLRDLLFYLQGREVRVTPGQQDGVRVLSPLALKGLAFPYVFAVGLNEGLMPHNLTEDWLLGEEERQAWGERGRPLPFMAWNRDQERYSFNLILSASRQRLYLSWVKGEEKGMGLPSRFLEEVGRVLAPPSPGGTLKVGELPRFFPFPCLEAMGLTRFLTGSEDWPGTGGITTWAEGQLLAALHPEEGRAETWGLEVEDLRRRGAMERARRQEAPGSWEGILGPGAAQAVGAVYHRERTYSATFFNEYGTCPFRFYLNRIVALGEEKQALDELTPLDKGSLYHQVLQELLEPYRREGRAPRLAEGPPLAEELRSILSRELAALEARTYLASRPDWPVEKARLEKNLLHWLEQERKAWDTMAAAGSTMAPAALELPFSGVTVAGLTFQGRIDRVDMDREGNYIVYDYKTRNTPGFRDMAEGREFQPLIYLAAVEKELKPRGEAWGAAFYSIEKGERNAGMWRAEYLKQAGISTRIGGKVEAEGWEAILAQGREYLQAYHRAMGEGRFPVLPSQCSGYCDYRRICRYDPRAALGKGGDSLDS